MWKSATSCSGTSSTANRFADNGFLQLRDDVPGLGLTLKTEYLDQFHIID